MLNQRSQVFITDDDFHAVVSICAIVLLIIAVTSIVGQIFTKITLHHKLALDDYATFPALVSRAGRVPILTAFLSHSQILFGAQTATILIASKNGLGQHWNTLTVDQQNVFEKVSGISLNITRCFCCTDNMYSLSMLPTSCLFRD